MEHLVYNITKLSNWSSFFLNDIATRPPERRVPQNGSNWSVTLPSRAIVIPQCYGNKFTLKLWCQLNCKVRSYILNRKMVCFVSFQLVSQNVNSLSENNNNSNKCDDKGNECCPYTIVSFKPIIHLNGWESVIIKSKARAIVPYFRCCPHQFAWISFTITINVDLKCRIRSKCDKLLIPHS